MPGARLAAEQQVERVGQHRLARAGLARDRVQPGPEPQLGPLDQQQVLDAQLEQHAARSTSGAADGQYDTGVPACHGPSDGADAPNFSRRRW